MTPRIFFHGVSGFRRRVIQTASGKVGKSFASDGRSSSVSAEPRRASARIAIEPRSHCKAAPDCTIWVFHEARGNDVPKNSRRAEFNRAGLKLGFAPNFHALYLATASTRGE